MPARQRKPGFPAGGSAARKRQQQESGKSEQFSAAFPFSLHSPDFLFRQTIQLMD
jgi:hypothetical protein